MAAHNSSIEEAPDQSSMRRLFGNVSLCASQNGFGIQAIGAAIPQEQGAVHVPFRSGELCGQDAAADIEADRWIAELCEGAPAKAVFSRHLSHHLHEAPGEGSHACFGFVGRSRHGASEQRFDVAFVERGFVAHGPAVPPGFLLDDGADQLGPKVMCAGGLLGQDKQIRRRFDFAHGGAEAGGFSECQGYVPPVFFGRLCIYESYKLFEPGCNAQACATREDSSLIAR